MKDTNETTNSNKHADAEAGVGMEAVVMRLVRRWLHRHHWRTTHTNKWMHPTRQECTCGLVREMVLVKGHGMPYEHAKWVCNDGSVSDYCVKI